MRFEEWIGCSEERRKKYEYYLGLGYSEAAAQVLSTVTYGDEDLCFLVKRFSKNNTIENLHAWLRSREEADPEEAIRACREEELSPPDAGQDLPDSAFYRTKSLCCFDALSATPEEETCLFDLDEEEDDAGNSGLFSMAIGRLASPSAGALSLAEELSSDEYEPIEEESAKAVYTAPSSTFRMTTGSASMGIVLNQIRSGRGVNMDQVRIEEVLNYFDYNEGAPADAKFRISTELLDKKENKKLLYIHVGAAEEKKDRRNIVLLLDTSGSMYGNADVTQAAVATVFAKLEAGDRVSLVTYSTKDHTLLDGYEIRDSRDKEVLMGVVLGIEIEGCTFGSAGIETAYGIGAKYYSADRSNQVILITDGDLNFGITQKNGLKDLIEEKKKSRLFLSVIGIGLYNYKDDKLEVLAKHGNGIYCVVNSLEDVDESVNRRFIALTNIVAKDVKAQVEFNPRFVRAYRLLGYENRQLSHEDFRNDAVISEPYGSGGHGVALYELEMTDGADNTPSAGLKYIVPAHSGSEELGMVTVRYKEPLGDTSFPIEAVIRGTEQSTQNIRLAYFLYCLSEKLRGSDKLDAYDEQYLDVMITGRLYRDLTGPNAEKLEALVDAYMLYTDRNDP